MICRRGLPFLGSTSSSWMPFRLSWMLSSSEPCNNPPEREEPCSPRSYFFFFLAFFVAFFFPFAPHFPQDIFSSSYSLVQGSYPYSSRCIQPHPSAIANERGALVETHQRLIEMQSWHKCLFTWALSERQSKRIAHELTCMSTLSFEVACICKDFIDQLSICCCGLRGWTLAPRRRIT